MGNLFLVPADENNLRATIKQLVLFSRVQSLIPQSALDQLRQRTDNNNGFYCWAMKRTSQNRFNKMNDGDIVILKPNGQNQNEGYFKYKGRVIFKTACPDLGRLLWPTDSGWNLVYFFGNIKKIKIKHSVLAQKLHYEQRISPTLPGTFPVARGKILRYIPDGNIDNFLDSIDELQ